MSAITLEIRSDPKIQPNHLPEKSNRSESDLANLAMTRYLARIQEGLAQAQRGEFISDEDMEAFFARYSEQQVTTKSLRSISGER
jgi:predicted transcriptional regulator